MSVRARFAPSPTGQVHIGNIRVAIFNWLFARNCGGKFLLRIEDTDRERSTSEAVQTVLDALEWLGLDYDEEPLYQSTRADAHLAAADSLLAAGHAYKEDKGGTGRGECVVFRMPARAMSFHDEVKGDLTKHADDLKDFVIVRSDGTPVFHLANVVDDIEMAVTHVIRGDDHIENTYRHVALYEALGAEAPKFAHLPMIVNEQGKPYSKRDGAAYVGEFRERKFLADALFNFLALLGWSPGEDRELMTREEMVEAFDLKRVKSGPARWDVTKFEWMNYEHLRRVPDAEYAVGFRDALVAGGLGDADVSEDYLARVIGLMRERTKVYTDIPAFSGFFFTDDYEYDDKAVRKRLLRDGVPELLEELSRRFRDLETFDAASMEAVLRELGEERGESAGKLVHPCRVAVSGLAVGPGLFEMLEVLGRERVTARLGRAVGMIRERSNAD